MIRLAGQWYEFEISYFGQPVLCKAGKPCGRGWIAESKKCHPDKRKHAIKNRKPDLERYANVKRKEKGLPEKSLPSLRPKLESQAFTAADLRQSRISFEGMLNNIVPTNSAQTELVDRLKADLKSLQDLARDAVIENRLRLNRIENDKLLKPVIEKLNNLYKGKITIEEAKYIALTKRCFEVLHPRKMIRVPKGTTQHEYAEIVSKIIANDKEAIKRYTVSRPGKKKLRKKNVK